MISASTFCGLLRSLRRSSRFVAIAVALLSVALSPISCTDGSSQKTPSASSVDSLYQRDEITVLITDSGLGGLSVVAAMEQKLRECHPFGAVRLVFANALPDEDRPYNRMANSQEKAAAFSAALAGCQKRYAPDVILIACNTLSVVYDETEFAKTAPIPVVGIVEFGVDMMQRALTEDTKASVVIVGTPTTIESGKHRQLLIDRGIDPLRVVTQGCDMLESEIQADPSSDVVAAMIDMYAVDALEKQSPDNTGRLFVGLCCTHYGYARDVFAGSFAGVFGREVTALDPNAAMADFLFRPTLCNRYARTDIQVEVVSRVPVDNEAIASISHVLESTSPAVAQALINMTCDQGLF